MASHAAFSIHGSPGQEAVAWAGSTQVARAGSTQVAWAESTQARGTCKEGGSIHRNLVHQLFGV